MTIYESTIYPKDLPDNGGPDIGETIPVTPQQSQALLRKIGQYGSFPKKVCLAFSEDTLMATWAQPNLTLGIEPDGYTHS